MTRRNKYLKYIKATQGQLPEIPSAEVENEIAETAPVAVLSEEVEIEVKTSADSVTSWISEKMIDVVENEQPNADKEVAEEVVKEPHRIFNINRKGQE